MTFRVGQQVTMIRPHTFSDMWLDEVQPVFGEVYTIRAIVTHPHCLGLMFQEIRNPSDRYVLANGECSFNSGRFRPVTKSKTDISVFKKMLTDKTVKEDA